MREVCRIAADVLAELAERVAPGVSTYELDQLGKKYIESYQAKSACYRYRQGNLRFPSYTCLSVNEEIVHGIGLKEQILKPGDIVAIDVSLVYRGFVGDNARTVSVGQVTPEVQRLMDTTQAALLKGIHSARHGNYVSDISGPIEDLIEGNGFSVVRNFVGHGVGRSLHEEPKIPNFRQPGTDKKLKAGMTLAIEPMVNMGRPEIELAADGWTALTRDRSPSAHFEHTVLVTREEPEILTLPGKV